MVSKSQDIFPKDSSIEPIPLDEYARQNYYNLRDRLTTCRRKFQADKEAQEDLKHYKAGNNSHNYPKLKQGLMPPQLVERSGTKYKKSDTFFTDFEKNNPESYILSSSEESLVIGNRASHDTRQYLAKHDPSGEDKTRAAGMSYVHLLVIPKKRDFFNVVALENNDIIREMISHFTRFWHSPGSIDKVNDRIRLAVEQRANEVVQSIEKEKDPSLASKRREAFEETMKGVNQYMEECAQRLKDEPLKMGEGGIVFRFHAWPDASIGHLHMHVLASPSRFRRFSTTVHDIKAIPAKIVMEVIDADSHHIRRLFYFMIYLLQYGNLISVRSQEIPGDGQR